MAAVHHFALVNEFRDGVFRLEWPRHKALARITRAGGQESDTQTGAGEASNHERVLKLQLPLL